MTIKLVENRSGSHQQPLPLPPTLKTLDENVSKTAIQQLSKKERRVLKKAQYQQQKEAQQNEQSKRVFTLFEQAFAGTRLPRNLIELIDRYGQLELDLEYPTPFLPYFYLNEIDSLKNYFSPACSTPAHLQAASKILEVADNLGDKLETPRICALFSEPLIYAFEFLKNSKGKTVLELGAGRGFASLLLGFSDADTIYVNDCDREVLGLFAKERDKIPPNVRKKFQVLEGDCLQDKTWKPIKNNAVDLAICGNLIHFFDPNQMKMFFEKLHQKLKPGGEGIFFTQTSQGYYNSQAQSVDSLGVLNRNLTCFQASTFCVFDKDEMIESFFHHMANQSEQTYLPKKTKTIIYQKKAENLWVQTPEHKQIGSKLRKHLDMHLKDFFVKDSNLAGNNIAMIKIVAQLFNKKFLTHLFVDNEFEIVTVFYLKEGHVEKNPSSASIDRIGIVCRKPKNMS